MNMPEIYAIDNNKSSNNITFIYDIPNTVSDLSSRVRSLEEENNSENKTKLRRYIPLETTGDIYSYTEGTSGMYGGKPSSINLMNNYGVIWDTLEDCYITADNNIINNLKITSNSPIGDLEASNTFNIADSTNINIFLKQKDINSVELYVKIPTNTIKYFQLNANDINNIVKKINDSSNINEYITGKLDFYSQIKNVDIYLENESDLTYRLIIPAAAFSYMTAKLNSTGNNVESDKTYKNEYIELDLEPNTQTLIFSAANIYNDEIYTGKTSDNQYWAFSSNQLGLFNKNIIFIPNYSKIDLSNYSDPEFIKFPFKCAELSSSTYTPYISPIFNTKERYINNSRKYAGTVSGNCGKLGPRNYLFTNSKDTLYQYNLTKTTINEGNTGKKESTCTYKYIITSDYINKNISTTIRNSSLKKETYESSTVTQFKLKGIEIENLSTRNYEIKCSIQAYQYNAVDDTFTIKRESMSIESNKELNFEESVILKPGEKKTLYEDYLFKLKENAKDNYYQFYLSMAYLKIQPSY